MPGRKSPLQASPLEERVQPRTPPQPGRWSLVSKLNPCRGKSAPHRAQRFSLATTCLLPAPAVQEPTAWGAQFFFFFSPGDRIIHSLGMSETCSPQHKRWPQGQGLSISAGGWGQAGRGWRGWGGGGVNIGQGQAPEQKSPWGKRQPKRLSI